MADVGFGVEAAARQFDLAFAEMAKEHYLLLYRADRLSNQNVELLTGLIRSDPFIDRLRDLPGHALDKPGEITTFEDLIEEDARLKDHSS